MHSDNIFFEQFNKILALLNRFRSYKTRFSPDFTFLEYKYLCVRLTKSQTLVLCKIILTLL